MPGFNAPTLRCVSAAQIENPVCLDKGCRSKAGALAKLLPPAQSQKVLSVAKLGQEPPLPAHVSFMPEAQEPPSSRRGWLRSGPPPNMTRKERSMRSHLHLLTAASV